MNPVASLPQSIQNNHKLAGCDETHLQLTCSLPMFFLLLFLKLCSLRVHKSAITGAAKLAGFEPTCGASEQEVCKETARALPRK